MPIVAFLYVHLRVGAKQTKKFDEKKENTQGKLKYDAMDSNGIEN